MNQSIEERKTLETWKEVTNRVKRHRKRFEDSERLRFNKHRPMPKWATKLENEAIWAGVLSTAIIILVPLAFNWIFDLIEMVIK